MTKDGGFRSIIEYDKSYLLITISAEYVSLNQCF